MHKLSICFIMWLMASVTYGCSKQTSENLPGAPDTVSRAGTLKIMTYNVHHANPPSRPGFIDLEAIARIIKESDADLVALQELDSLSLRSERKFQLSELARLTGMKYFYARTIPYDGGAYGIGVLSKLEISEARNIALPEDPAYAASEDRALALVKVKLGESASLYFACTHLDVNKEENRILQARKIIDVAMELNAPFILAGDLNSTEQSESFRILSSLFVPASVKKAPTIPVINPNRKIDHILYAKPSDFSLLKEEVLSKETYASDHLPFTIELKVNGLK